MKWQASGGRRSSHLSVRLMAGLGEHMATAGPQGCISRAENWGWMARTQELVQLADTVKTPMPTRTDVAGIRPVAGLGQKLSFRANDTAAYCDRCSGSAASRTS